MGIFFFIAVALVALAPAQAEARSKRLNYLRAHTLRVSAADDFRDWVLPIRDPLSPRDYTVRLHSFFSRNNDIPELYDEIKKRQRALLEQRLTRSFGKPYDLAAKASLQGKIGPFHQSFSVNAGAAFTAHDPIFPELEGLLFNDFSTSTAYEIELPYKFRIRPQLVQGVRRLFEANFTAGQIIDSKPNTRLKTFPYKYFSELNLDIARRFDYFELFLNYNSIPLKQRELVYWDSDMGIRSANLVRIFRVGLPAEATLWASFSPFYGGDYERWRTVKLGLSTRWFHFAELDVFFSDNFHFGALLGLRAGPIGAFAFTFGRADDDYGTFFSRQYGAGVNIQF